ncbi:hypothetical protein AVEN_274680-1 [Araneus ventricosus]|uniref:Uncharacterized protein n=1 Tax=Araneus ventricosus TaxID=182803 RepID=A0A4Y2WPA0_ARAVE|nr:hypothetical protein AVEN_274680-1 [Araneus ventricosus]
MRLMKSNHHLEHTSIHPPPYEQDLPNSVEINDFITLSKTPPNTLDPSHSNRINPHSPSGVRRTNTIGRHRESRSTQSETIMLTITGPSRERTDSSFCIVPLGRSSRRISVDYSPRASLTSSVGQVGVESKAGKELHSCQNKVSGFLAGRTSSRASTGPNAAFFSSTGRRRAPTIGTANRRRPTFSFFRFLFSRGKHRHVD